MATDLPHRLSLGQQLVWWMERHHFVERAVPSDAVEMPGTVLTWK